MIVPIGVDCNVAFILNEHQVRQCSLPFDWVVTFGGVSDIIASGFARYLPPDQDIVCRQSNTLFWHANWPEDIPKYQRRIARLKRLLEASPTPLTFLRFSHAPHHHGEAEKYRLLLKNDIRDAEDLDSLLKHRYPCLAYKIALVLCCGECFDDKRTYQPTSRRIEIYNCAAPELDIAALKCLFRQIRSSLTA